MAATHGGDAELLARFATQRDEAAFAELVRRHGPAVLGVCRRLLGETPDADDAFQAAFLILARKAARISRPDLLGNWLYGVAYRVAVRARAQAARRRSRERPLLDVAATNPPPAVEWADIRVILDDEVNRLPHKHRTAFVLCCIEGRTAAEASDALGCPEGTVHSRLSWARGRLRSRLTRRGLTPAVGTLAWVLDRHAAAAAVSPVRTATTVKCALSFAGGTTGTAPAGAAALATFFLGGTMTRLKLAAVLVAAAGMVGLGGLAGGHAVGQDRPQPKPIQRAVRANIETAAAAKPDDDSVSVKSTSPVVVKTVPPAGDTDVDAAKVTEIRVTFSKEMVDKSWSWSQISDETFPKTTAKPHFEADKKTCVLPVKLEPGKTYVLWLNPPKFQGFRDADGHAAVFYPLVFETKK